MKKATKVIAGIAMMICMAAALCGCGKKETLKLFLPGEYLGENVIADFEDEYNCKVIVETFDSNEAMMTKVQAGDKYDVLIPSDYMIERLLKENMLQKIDKSVVTRLDVLVDQVKNAGYDPNNDYSVPYFWGNAGIVYNNKNVTLEELEEQGYDIFANPKYKDRVYMYDSERDGFMIALKQLGYSCNTENDAEIEEAYQWLLAMNKATNPVYNTDEIIDNMIHGLKDLALMYSGDAVTITMENEDMSYFVPDCGTNLWIDAMVIPANAENPKLANKFLNFMLNYDQCEDGALTVCYTTPNKDVLADLTKEGGEFEGIDSYVPRANAENDELYHDNEHLRKKLAELWIKVKAK